MSRRALYYPEWGIPDPALLFDALLYWDRLACIVPYEGFQPLGAIDREFRRESDALHDRFVTGIAPSEDQKTAVHKRISGFIDRPPLDWYRPENLRDGQRALVSALKLAVPTEELLRERGWMRPGPSGPERLQQTSLAVANLVLGELVAEISSDTLPPITGDAVAYAATTNTLLHELGAPAGLAADGGLERVATAETDNAGLLIIGFLRLGLERGKVTPSMLKRLGEVRQDSGLEEQRARFGRRVDQYVLEIRAAPAAERALVQADLKQEIQRDRKALKSELRRAGLDAIVDKDSLVALFFSGGIGGVANLAVGPIGLVIGLGLTGTRMLNDFRRGRREVAGRHWTSFLLALERPRLSIAR